MTVYPIVLSGGSGTRLWPVSRSLYPKQLLSIASEATMLQATIARTGDMDFASPFIVAGEDHRFHIAEQLDAIGVTPTGIILEPAGRNTAAAIAIAAHAALAEDPDARSEEHTSELQSLMRISYAVFCLTKKNNKTT